MSRETLQAIEDAILAHHRATTDPDNPDRATAVITGWVVAYESSNLIDFGVEHGGTVVGFANDYIASDCSPNMHISLAGWAGQQIYSDAFDLDDD